MADQRVAASFRQGRAFLAGDAAHVKRVRRRPLPSRYATGAFVHEDPAYLESTGFVLDPEGRVLVGVYSTNAIGRLVPEDVIGLIRYTERHRRG